MTHMPVAVVTGGNRGLGKETCRQLAAQGYKVLLGSRELSRGREVAGALEGDVEAVEIDVKDTEQAALRDRLEALGRVDALVNCAGILGEARYTSSILEVSWHDLQEVVNTNVMGAIRLAALVVPLMKRRDAGCIVNVSSGMGQLHNMQAGAPVYRLSKTALNAATRILSRELADTRIRVNSVCPGWVRTDMGGPDATLGVEEGAKGIVWAATLPATGPTGGFFRHGKAIEW